MLTAGRRGRKRTAIIGLIVFAAIMHLPAYAVIGRFADLQEPLDKSDPDRHHRDHPAGMGPDAVAGHRIGNAVFYARADLDLIMSSPVALANVFSVRIAAIALQVIAMALLLSTPFVDVLVIGGGWSWLAAFGVVVAIGLSAAAVAIAVTVVLFRLIGPSRTRLVAQIRRSHRRRLCYRATGRRDPVLRHVVAVCGADVGCRGGLCTRARQRLVVAGARRARRRRSAARVCWPAASCCSAP